MTRFRTLAALAAAVTIAAACADTPTAPTAAAPSDAPLASVGACTPYLGGQTAVTSGLNYSYRLYYNGCDIDDVSWWVGGGTITTDAGSKIFVDAVGPDCMVVYATAHYADGTTRMFTRVAKVDGYTGVCPTFSVE